MHCGIYRIINNENGRSYIGSSSRIEGRWSGHRYLLRNNKHHCPGLQNAWNKYGELNFNFEILELCDIDNLLDYEEKLIRGHTGPILYNVGKEFTTRRGYKMPLEEREKLGKEFTVKNLRGEVYTACNISLFAEQHNLSHAHLHAVIQGKRSSHKGWTLVDERPRIVNAWPGKKISIKLFNPDSVLIEEECTIKEFSLKHNLNESMIRKLIKGTIKNYKQWRLDENEEQDNSYLIPDLLSPTGKVYSGYRNISKFAREHNLNRHALLRVLKGTRKAHRGWKLVMIIENPNKKEIGNLIPDLTDGEGKLHTNIRNISKFAREHNLNPACIRFLVTGRLKSHKGWTLHKENIQ